ncbi:hypothetical protein Patl1_14025 [Pistacia atlantica]|uniref:Uncharacterized protein n=1 Tax=Pistacia atlantica TaxID=434234 RepID=A0ACC1AU67_9ROSI|nr:hypothetical protein Patl1_14025 [Pistacia atlantica]
MGSSTFGERTPMDSLVLEKVTTEPQPLGFEHSILFLVGTEKTDSMFDANEGEVLSWGGGGSGRLGHGHESSILGFLSSSSSSYELIDTFCTVNTHQDLSRNLRKSRYFICVDSTEKGCVFIFGERAADKMVFQDRKNATTPSMISKLPYSDEVACGGYTRVL